LLRDSLESLLSSIAASRVKYAAESACENNFPAWLLQRKMVQGKRLASRFPALVRAKRHRECGKLWPSFRAESIAKALPELLTISRDLAIVRALHERKSGEQNLHRMRDRSLNAGPVEGSI
jgi:hypothetical protein